ncbi:hypothetical protein EVAR_29634_1 [Eumeta japonica]|uniref:Uncharacterized protein n=1 Tax=Eumeta variegata TaxID=151549 RepID=A0A4C1W946_EUMVA|nr:hypothetical protein EVAR_29634_1 [Eumeta japonica]
MTASRTEGLTERAVSANLSVVRIEPGIFRISDGVESAMMKENRPQEILLTGRNVTSDAVTLHLYSASVWHLTVRAGPFLSCS